jgi:hypothetical protein
MMTNGDFVRRWTRRSAGIAVLAAWALGAGTFPAVGEALPAPGTARKRPTYTPSEVGAPRTRVAAATRGQGQAGGPCLSVLAPEQTGHTMAAGPTLYWFVAQPFAGPIKLAVTDETQLDPVLELRLDRGAPAGVHEVPLGARKVALRPGIEYEWSVTLVVDPNRPSGDVFASGTIRRVAPVALPRGADDVDRLAALAGQGLWYDAIELASRHIAARPKDPAWRGLRADLLEQQGLTVPAAYDRERAGLQ